MPRCVVSGTMKCWRMRKWAQPHNPRQQSSDELSLHLFPTELGNLMPPHDLDDLLEALEISRGLLLLGHVICSPFPNKNNHASTSLTRSPSLHGKAPNNSRFELRRFGSSGHRVASKAPAVSTTLSTTKVGSSTPMGRSLKYITWITVLPEGNPSPARAAPRTK